MVVVVAVNIALTFTVPVLPLVTVHVFPEALHPDQPENVEPDDAEAVSVILDPVF